MVDFAKVEIGGTGEFLDGVKVTTPAGADLFRETQVAADPVDADGLAKVKNEAPAVDDYGLVVRVAGQVQTEGLETGVWGYLSGVQGAAVVPAGARVLQISAAASNDSPASFSVNGGPAIVIPAFRDFTFEPKGNLVAPSVVFTNTTSFVIEYVT